MNKTSDKNGGMENDGQSRAQQLHVMDLFYRHGYKYWMKISGCKGIFLGHLDFLLRPHHNVPKTICSIHITCVLSSETLDIDFDGPMLKCCPSSKRKFSMERWQPSRLIITIYYLIFFWISEWSAISVQHEGYLPWR